MQETKASVFRVVPGLAISNLTHEWILSLCLVIAVAAVVAPLIVLLGLKFGTIETLRNRLVEDPVYREIRPAQIHEFTEQRLQEISSWPEVQFVAPSVLPLSSIVHVQYSDSNDLKIIDLFTTGPGDPLLEENNISPPKQGECVLTAEAARSLGLEDGEYLEAKVTRSRGGQKEMAGSRLLISGVLPVRAGSLPRMYCPLDFVRDVEAYKQGYAVPGRGWSGDRAQPYLSYDGVVLLMTRELSPIARSGLIINTGFARITRISQGQVRDLTGISSPENWTAYQIMSPGTQVTMSSLRALKQKLRGREHILLPYVQDMVLLDARKRQIQPVGLSLSPVEADILDIWPLPWGGFTGRVGPGSRLTQVLIPETEPERDQTLILSSADELEVPLKAAGSTNLKSLVIPAELAGVLRTAQQQEVSYDPATGEFVLVRGGYRGFRLYTASIDDVPAVAARLEEQGTEVIAQVESIQRIQVLDAGLGRLYGLLAGLGICGGAAVLLSSLYAAVERLKKDLGILRLVGLARGHVFILPVIQGQLLAAAGLILGGVAAFFLARIINHSFASELAHGEKFCTLPLVYMALIVLSTQVLALISSLAAAWRATHIDPAEVLRES